jgi:hypothetical protein
MDPIATPSIRAPEPATAIAPASTLALEAELLALRTENERLQALVTGLLLKNQKLRFALKQAQLQSAAAAAFI